MLETSVAVFNFFKILFKQSYFLLRDYLGFSVSDWKVQEAKGWSGKAKQKT